MTIFYACQGIHSLAEISNNLIVNAQPYKNCLMLIIAAYLNCNNLLMNSEHSW